MLTLQCSAKPVSGIARLIVSLVYPKAAPRLRGKFFKKPISLRVTQSPPLFGAPIVAFYEI